MRTTYLWGLEIVHSLFFSKTYYISFPFAQLSLSFAAVVVVDFTIIYVYLQDCMYTRVVLLYVYTHIDISHNPISFPVVYDILLGLLLEFAYKPNMLNIHIHIRPSIYPFISYIIKLVSKDYLQT